MICEIMRYITMKYEIIIYNFIRYGKQIWKAIRWKQKIWLDPLSITLSITFIIKKSLQSGTEWNLLSFCIVYGLVVER